MRHNASIPLVALLLSLPLSGASAQTAGRDWPVYGGDKGSTRFSTLKQIDRSNVKDLRPAWTFRTGDKRDSPPTTMECSPIVVDGVMYVTSAFVKVFAVNAATGEKLWQFDPGPANQNAHRGVTYWRKGRDRRILFTAGSSLYALNAETGKPVPTFGDGGKVDIRQGLDRDPATLHVDATTPGVVYGNLYILGTSLGEGPGPTAPGHVRAYDARTGKVVWTFRTIPRPGERGYETWGPDSWKTSGGANAWGGLSVDEKRGMVFLATGSPAYDFFGNDRLGDNLFSDSIVALKADSGEYVWHFQTVRHDLWDYDLPCPPVLATVKHDGRKVDAVAQVTKMGFVFLLDRESGKPLFPVEDRPVPASRLAGEIAAATQPFPLKPPPFTRQRFTEADITDLSPEATADVLKRFRAVTPSGLYTPPVASTMVQFPGFHGGANWSGAAFDPTSGRLFVNANEMPVLQTMEARSGQAYPFVSTGYFRFTDPEGYPAIKPPWGTLTSVDLNRGEIAWQKPLGEYPELVKRGIRNTGTENLGGCIVTAGGLVFIGATKDSKFRAFDKETGAVLWEAQLETGGNATPCTYQVNGKQYVVIAAGGGSGRRIPEKWDTKPGDAFVAFALP